MASGIHTLSPQNNMNLISESILYNNSSKGEYGLHGFVNYEVEETKMPLNLEKMIACNNNKEYESDESTMSNSSRESPINKETKCTCQNTDNDRNNHKYKKVCVYQPNLYYPNVCYNNKNNNSKSHYRGGQHPKYGRNSQEFERKVHGLMIRFKSRVYKMKVDSNPQTLLNGGPWDSLNQTIWDAFVSKVEKEESYISKLNLWERIFRFFRMSFKSYGLYLVGSTMSGFAIEGSDIDICFLIKPLSNEPRIDSLHHLHYLQHALLKDGIASEAELIMAKVPILKFKNKETGFEIDLNCNNIVGVQNTRLLWCYAQLDWRVRPLVIIVKIWAQANKINDAKNMTISSYSWTLMVIHYLQCGVFPPVLPCIHNLYPEEFSSMNNHALDIQGQIEGLKDFKSENTRCLGDLLIGFFHYYSYFNYQHYAISVRTGSRLPIETCKQVKTPKNDPHQWKFLCIEEPFDLSNTAKSVFDFEIFKHIKHVITASYKELACNKNLNHILPITER